MSFEEIESNLKDEVKDEDESIAIWVALGLAYSVDIITTKLQREIAILRGAGIGDSNILRILNGDLGRGGRIFGEFRNAIKRGIIGGIMQSNRVGQSPVYGNSLMQWVSVGSPRICPDCQSRIGQQATYSEWEAMGLPASGFSVCKEYCYCQLVPTEVKIDNPVIV